MPSFYLLEISVKPGGARKGLNWLLGSEDEVRAALAEDFIYEDQTDTGTLALVTGDDEAIQLTPYQDGQPGDTVNLLPYLTVDLVDYPPVTFVANGRFDHEAFNAGYVDETGDGYRDRVQQLINDDEVEVTDVQLDWEGAGIPALHPPILQPDEEATVYSAYTDQPAKKPLKLSYGFHDLENDDPGEEEEDD